MPTYLKIILAVLLVLLLALLFTFVFLLNKKTKVPDNCPKAEIGCAGCMLNCGKREEEMSIKKVTSNITENYTSDLDKDAKDKKEEEKKEGK
jgi:hypothetical protein